MTQPMQVQAESLPERNNIGFANDLVLQDLDNYVRACDGAIATITWV
jgi:hypothetical protein